MGSGRAGAFKVWCGKSEAVWHARLRTQEKVEAARSALTTERRVTEDTAWWGKPSKDGGGQTSARATPLRHSCLAAPRLQRRDRQGCEFPLQAKLPPTITDTNNQPAQTRGSSLSFSHQSIPNPFRRQNQSKWYISTPIPALPQPIQHR
jgi:hypothetical protein